MRYTQAMHVTSYRTPIIHPGDDLFSVLAATLPRPLPERSVVAITSKIVALSENRVVPLSEAAKTDPVIERAEKHSLVRQYAEQYTDPHSSKYHMMLAVIHGMMFVNAGIDESNVQDAYVLWPENPQAATNQIWEFLRAEFGVKELGVIMTDSKTQPLFWGVIGASIAHCGFQALNKKIGMPDLFGREMQMTHEGVAQALAAAAVFEMGEAAEQTPLAVVSDIRDITFQDRVPTKEELEFLRIELEDDVYAPVLQTAPWKKGGASVAQAANSAE